MVRRRGRPRHGPRGGDRGPPSIGQTGPTGKGAAPRREHWPGSTPLHPAHGIGRGEDPRGPFHESLNPKNATNANYSGLQITFVSRLFFPRGMQRLEGHHGHPCPPPLRLQSGRQRWSQRGAARPTTLKALLQAHGGEALGSARAVEEYLTALERKDRYLKDVWPGPPRRRAAGRGGRVRKRGRDLADVSVLGEGSVRSGGG